VQAVLKALVVQQAILVILAQVVAKEIKVL
jgi:hypothetical protein